MYAYAIKNNLCNTDYAKFVDIAKYKDRNPNSYDRQPIYKRTIECIVVTKRRYIHPNDFNSLLYRCTSK